MPTILLVDDEATFAGILCHHLTREGYTVVLAVDGVAAWRRGYARPRSVGSGR